MPDPGALAIDLCRQLGFAAAGICSAEPTTRADELIAWLEAGRAGSMEYLREQLEFRLDPQKLLPGAKSIIMVADLYSPRSAAEPEAPPLHGKVARYARGRDYHLTIKKRLHALADALRAHLALPPHIKRAASADKAEVSPHGRSGQAGPRRFRSFVDTAPILEREYAARAGLGWIGKHTLLIHPRIGSYTLLGGIATTLELKPPPEQSAFPDHCGTCTRCIDACPTRAITPYSVDGSRCISYLTIERREAIDPALHTAIGDWIYGCDICQEVCPHNSPRPDLPGAALAQPDYAAQRSSLGLLEVLNWTEQDRRTTFETSSMKRATLAMMKRNAIICAGNALTRRDDPGLRSRLRQVSEDAAEPELVRLTASQVLARLGG